MDLNDVKFWKKARLSAGLSQAEVANKLNYSSSQLVSNWERGLCNPPQKNLKVLLKLYNINTDDYIEAHIMLERKKIKKLLKTKS